MTKPTKEMTVQELEVEIRRCELAIGEAESLSAQFKAMLTEARSQYHIKTRPVIKPTVTDHALIRFIERAIGVDIEAVRKRILSGKVVSGILSGASKVTVDGIKMVVKDRKIITVIPKGK